MKVEFTLTLAVDPDEWRDAYGTEGCSDDDVRDDVCRWVWNAVSHHPNGLVESAFVL